MGSTHTSTTGITADHDPATGAGTADTARTGHSAGRRRATRTRRLGAAVLALGSAAALAACNDSTGSNGTGGSDAAGNSAPVTVTQTVVETQASSSPSQTSAAAGAKGSATLNSVVLGGQPVSLATDSARCEWGHDDGRDQLELDVDRPDGRDGLNVEIVADGVNRLDDLSLETPTEEWEAEDAQRAQATVENDGDRWTVTSQVTDDKDHARTTELRAEFTCPR
ncbi:hypothetical protein MTQ22_03675 [Corynebacterium bovis]|uniref:hypothetical protein n=1 Tax=Corynebacterium bovis TaxID=36808 RepID=UPI0031394BA7